MTTSRTIVKETFRQDIQRRPPTPGTQTPGAPNAQGRKVGDEVRIEITPERVRVRAYEISVARNGGPGDELSDWCRAERELNGCANACGDAHACGEPSLETKTRV